MLDYNYKPCWEFAGLDRILTYSNVFFPEPVMTGFFAVFFFGPGPSPWVLM